MGHSCPPSSTDPRTANPLANEADAIAQVLAEVGSAEACLAAANRS